MLAILMLSILMSPPVADSRELDPQQQAQIYAAAGEEHLKRAAAPGEQQLDEFDGAHKNFDLAFLTADDTRHLCRALLAAELALLTVTFTDEQARMSWEEVRRDDLGRLQRSAADTRRANCRYDAKGDPVRSRVAVLSDADVAAASQAHARDPPPAGRLEPPGPTPAQWRRWNARTITGAIFTGAGIGLVGVLAGAISLQVRQAELLHGIFDNARATGGLSDADRGRAEDLRADGIQTRNVAIGVGIAGAVSMATGVALLVTRKKPARPLALVPYGGPLGGGAVLRLRF